MEIINGLWGKIVSRFFFIMVSYSSNLSDMYIFICVLSFFHSRQFHKKRKSLNHLHVYAHYIFLIFSHPQNKVTPFYGIPEEKTKKGELRIWSFQGGIDEITSGISRSLLKTRWNFQGWSRKNEISRGLGFRSHNFWAV